VYLKNIKQLDKLNIPRHIEIHCEVQGFWYVFWGSSHTAPQFWWPWMFQGIFRVCFQPRVLEGSWVKVDSRSEVNFRDLAIDGME